MQRRCRPSDGAAAGDCKQDDSADRGARGQDQGVRHAAVWATEYVPPRGSSLTFPSMMYSRSYFCKCSRHLINDAVSVPGLQSEMEKLENFVQGSCSVKSMPRTCVGMLRSSMSCLFFLPELQKKVRVDEDETQASEWENFFFWLQVIFFLYVILWKNLSCLKAFIILFKKNLRF